MVTVIMGHFPAVNILNKSSKYQRINTFTKLTINALPEVNSVQHTELSMCVRVCVGGRGWMGVGGGVGGGGLC